MSQFCCPSLPLSPSAWSPPELTAEYCSQSHDSFLSSFSLMGSPLFLTTPWTFFVSVSCPPGKWHVGDTWPILLHVLGGRHYQGIQLNELFRGEHFPFFPFLPFAKPCTESPARHCKKGPSRPKHQMQSSSETPAREVSHSGYRRKSAIPPLAFSNLCTGKHLWPLWLDERISSHVGISYMSWEKTPVFPFLHSREITTLRWGGELQVCMPANNTTGGVFLQKGDLQRHSPSH